MCQMIYTIFVLIIVSIIRTTGSLAGMSPPGSFSKEQLTWCVTQFGQLGSDVQIRRKFRTHFKLSLRRVPSLGSFHRLLTRFNGTGDVKCRNSSGKPGKVTPEKLEDIRNVMLTSPGSSMTTVMKEVGLSRQTTWKVMRKKLKFYLYETKTVVPLTEQHKRARIEFCNWICTKPQEFLDKVIWSDEKLPTNKMRDIGARSILRLKLIVRSREGENSFVGQG